MPIAYTILYYAPHAMAVIFLVVLGCSNVAAKGHFLARAVVALVLATFLAHADRIFHYDPAYLYFPSGHMTFCLGVSISLAMIWPWTLGVTLPLLVVFGRALVTYHCHTVADVLGAIPLVLIVYGIIHAIWRIPSTAPLLDRAKVYL